VEQKGWQGCTLPKQLYNNADKLEKCSLLSAIASGLVMEGYFPFEVVKFKLLGKWVSRSPRQTLEADWGHNAALELYDAKEITLREDFILSGGRASELLCPATQRFIGYGLLTIS
jgi:hypothetical protein